MSCRRNGLRKLVTEAKEEPWSSGEKGQENAPGGGGGEKQGLAPQREPGPFIPVPCDLFLG